MASLTIEVPTELERRLKERADQHGIALSDYVRPALEALAEPGPSPTASTAPQTAGETPAPSTGESVLAMVEDIWGEVPPEERSALPSDLSENHDHYLYGIPKKT